MLEDDHGPDDFLCEHARQPLRRRVGDVEAVGRLLAGADHDDWRAGPLPVLCSVPVALLECAQGRIGMIDQLIKGAPAVRAVRAFETLNLHFGPDGTDFHPILCRITADAGAHSSPRVVAATAADSEGSLMISRTTPLSGTAASSSPQHQGAEQSRRRGDLHGRLRCRAGSAGRSLGYAVSI